MSESDREVADEYKSLFKGFSFNFEGLKDSTKEGFVQLVKDMAAEVSDNAQYTFVQKSYFQEMENPTKDKYYDINFIMDAVKKVNAGNLRNYKLGPNEDRQESNDDPMCFMANYVFKTDSCYKYYYEKIFCRECAETNAETMKETDKFLTMDTCSDVTNSSFESEDEIQKTPTKKVEKSISDSSKRLISSDSEDNSNDEVSSKSTNGKSMRPPSKKSKNLNDADETSYERMSLEMKVENPDSRSDTDSFNISDKEKNGESTNTQPSIKISPTKSKAVQVADENSIEDDDLSDSSNNKKQPQKADNKGLSSWIMPSKPMTIAPHRKEKPVESSDEDSEFEIGSDNEDETYIKRKKWWVPHEIPEKEQCTVINCTFEPGTHRSHYRPKKFLSSDEKEIILKYLINNNEIEHSKGKVVYESMISAGYLSHRTWETLRNCFRRTILKKIKTYNLDSNILQQFMCLEDGKPVTIKKEKF